MTINDILLTVLFVHFVLVAFMTFGSLAWSAFEDTKVGSAISEWIISKFKGEDEK